MSLTATFLILLLGGALILGGAFAITRRKSFEVDQRLNLFASATQKAAANELLAKSLTARTKRVGLQIGRLLLLNTDHPWKTRTSSAKLAVVALASAGMIWLLSQRVFGLSTTIALPVMAFAAFLMPRMVLVRERKRTEQVFTNLFPDAVDSVARMLRAGMPITAAMQAIGDEGQPPVNAVFATIANQMKIGIPISDALKMSSRQIGLPDFAFFAVAVVLQQSAGGNLISTLDVLSQIMRKRRAIQLKAQAVTSEIRFSAYVLGALPFLTTAALLFIQPDYLTPLFTDPRGHVILGIAGGGLLLSILTMRQMMRSISSV